MNNIKSNVLWAAGSTVVALIIVVVFHLGGVSAPPQVSNPTLGVNQSGAGITNVTGAISIASGNGVTPGFIEVPQVSYYSAAGDVNQQGIRQNMVASSSAICAFQNPSATASSTYEFGYNISSTSASAGMLILGAGATQGATTTANGSWGVSANTTSTNGTQGTTTSSNAGVVGPNQWLSLGAVGGNTAALLQYGGTCNNIWTNIL